MVQLLGATVIFPKKTVCKLAQITERAQQYSTKKRGRYLLPFGLDSPKIKELYRHCILPLRTQINVVGPLWCAAGSTVIAQTLANIFPEAEMYLVQVGKKIWPDQLSGATIHVHPARFRDPCKAVPPYDTPLTYDGKVWDMFLAAGATGQSFLWNTAGVVTEARVRQFIATTDAAICATHTRIKRLIVSAQSFPYISAGMPPARTMFENLRQMANDMPPCDKVVSNFSADYLMATGISNHFTCPARMRCVVTRTRMSPESYWQQNKARACEHVVRYEGVVGATFHPECNTFNPLILTNLIKNYFPIPSAVHVLDGAMGYGDRLAACLALKVASYTGYDPNYELREGLLQMCEELGGPTEVSLHFTKFPEQVAARQFDLAILSPPFFDQEIYPGSEKDTTGGLNDWVARIYSPMLLGIARSMAPGGIIGVYIDNIPRTGPLADITADTLREGGATFQKRIVFVSQVIEPSGFLKEGCERSLWVYRI
jgi:hypothetical protein